jgi:CPA2 family monovalent cation:H+ antiporter-2
MSTASIAQTLVPATQAAHSGDYSVFVIVFLLASAVVVPVFQRLKISPVLGFLLVGVLLGPDVMGLIARAWPKASAFAVTRSHTAHTLAELGVVFLLFSIGLELTFERLKLMRRMVFGLGAAQLLLSTFVLTGLFLWMRHSFPAAMTLGMALALSSTAMVVPVLTERKALHTPAGKGVFAVLLAQDLAVAPIMVAISMITGATAKGADEATGAQGLLALIPALIGMGVLVVGGRFLLRPLFKGVVRAKSRELFMAACLLVVLASGEVAILFGLTMGIGAFVAGVLLAETEYRREIEVMIDPFKGLLLGLFFVTVGGRLEIASILAHPGLVFGIAAGLIALKAAVVYPAARAFGLKRGSALEAALVLGPAGEFAFVIIDEAITRHVLSHAFGQAVILSAIVSLFCVPLLADLGLRLSRRLAPAAPPPPEAPEVAGEGAPVLIIGFGRVGEHVANLLRVHDIAFTAVDIDPGVAARARKAGIQAWYGDASHLDLLRRMGLERARAVVITASSAALTEACVDAVRQARSDVHIIARARDARHAQRLYQLGATDAVPETFEASLQLAENTLIDLGVPMGLVIASIHEERDQFRQRFGIRREATARQAAVKSRATWPGQESPDRT